MATSTNATTHRQAPSPASMDTNLSEKFNQMALSSGDTITTKSTHLNHNDDPSKSKSSSTHNPSRSMDIFDYATPKDSLISTERQNYSEDVADRNLKYSGHVADRNMRYSVNLHQNEDLTESVHQSLQEEGQNYSLDKAESGNSTKIKSEHNPTSSSHVSNVNKPEAASMKPLPVSLASEASANSDNSQSHKPQAEAHHTTIDENTKKSLASAGVDLNNVTDTVQHTQLVPAVTHETVQPVVHEVRTEKITREIHNVDVYHRILPIHDVEVLPARHFVRTPSGGLEEIDEARIPEVLGVSQKL